MFQYNFHVQGEQPYLVVCLLLLIPCLHKLHRYQFAHPQLNSRKEDDETLLLPRHRA